MWRILCQWRGIRLYAYPVALYLGILLGVISGTYFASLRGLNPTRAYSAMLLLVPVALVGARLLFVFTHWQFYRQRPSRIWKHSEGGAALYGGLLLALLFSLPVLSILALPLGAFWDAATVAILTGMIFARIGCLLNGCCAGRPDSGRLSLNLPNLRGVWCRRVPTQLLEAALAATLLGASIAFKDRLPFDGALFICVLAAYSAVRWWLESAKEIVDTIRSVSIQRGLSATFFAACAIAFVVLWVHTL